MVQSSTAYVGDVHKDSIELAIADEREVRHYGRIGGEGASLDRAVRKLRSVHRKLVLVYEAGPCGFWIYRRVTAQGLACMVVSPSMTPRTAVERIKTDRRDALKLALSAGGRARGDLCPGCAGRGDARPCAHAGRRCMYAAPGAAATAGAASEARDPLCREDRLDEGASALDRAVEAPPPR
jgi:hypothetical protein